MNGPARGRTLTTRCRCGHERRAHTGLRIDVNGRCLDCDCELFAPEDDALAQYEAILRGMQAAIARVERIQLLAEGTAGAVARTNGGTDRRPGR